MARILLKPSVLWFALSLAVGLGTAAIASAEDDVAVAEHLARTRFFEGVPAEEARRIGDAGAARLGEMLSDQSEARHHPQIIEVLGMSGHPLAWPTLRREAADMPRGEVDRAVFRKRFALRVAMGHLARHDERALAELLEEADGRRSPPTWSCERHRGARLEALLRRSSVNALALSGRSEAQRALRRLRRNADDAEFERGVLSALAEFDRVERQRAAAGSRGRRGSSR